MNKKEKFKFKSNLRIAWISSLSVFGATFCVDPVSSIATVKTMVDGVLYLCGLN